MLIKAYVYSFEGTSTIVSRLPDFGNICSENPYYELYTVNTRMTESPFPTTKVIISVFSSSKLCVASSWLFPW